MTTSTIETSPQLYARIGGALYLIIIVIGLFGEAFVRRVAENSRLKFWLPRQELIFHLRVPHVCPGLANVGPGPKPRTSSSRNGAMSTGDVNGIPLLAKDARNEAPRQF